MSGEMAGDALWFSTYKRAFWEYFGDPKSFFPERMGIGGTRYGVVKLHAEDKVA